MIGWLIPIFKFHFLPLAVRYDGTSPAGGHGYQVHVGPMNSDARGYVKIRSKDPQVYPNLRFNYLSTEQDRREWVEAIRCARKILGQPAMNPFNAGEISPGPSVETDQQILDWVAKDAETALHPSCTNKMGLDKMSVVNPKSMKVHGVENLRVVDASVMPYVTNGNLYAPVMMIAEKSADLILGNTPLAPAGVEFYQHPRSENLGIKPAPSEVAEVQLSTRRGERYIIVTDNLVLPKDHDEVEGRRRCHGGGEEVTPSDEDQRSVF